MIVDGIFLWLKFLTRHRELCMKILLDVTGVYWIKDDTDDSDSDFDHSDVSIEESSDSRPPLSVPNVPLTIRTDFSRGSLDCPKCDFQLIYGTNDFGTFVSFSLQRRKAADYLVTHFICTHLPIGRDDLSPSTSTPEATCYSCHVCSYQTSPIPSNLGHSDFDKAKDLGMRELVKHCWMMHDIGKRDEVIQPSSLAKGHAITTSAEGPKEVTTKEIEIAEEDTLRHRLSPSSGPAAAGKNHQLANLPTPHGSLTINSFLKPREEHH
jgi:hypothetical protein